MAKIRVTVRLKPSPGVRLKQLWMSRTTLNTNIEPIALNAVGAGQAIVLKGTPYYLFYQFYGNPGDTIGVTITCEGNTLLELKESKIPPGQTYQAGVREFQP